MSQTNRSPRNRTLSLTAEETGQFFAQCLDLSHADDTSPLLLSDVTDRTICADSFSVLERLPKNFAKLAVIDPPYNLNKTYSGKSFGRMSHESYASYTERYLSQVLPCLTSDASLYICCDWKSSIDIAQVLTQFESEKKLVVRNRITWQREKGRGAVANWKNGMEDIWFCTVSDCYTFNLDAVKVRRRVLAPYREDGKPKDWHVSQGQNVRDTCPSNFWDDISIPFWSMPENTDHPTQKPEKLMAKLILASSNPGDTVLDPFSGSGTTLVTACKLGRHFTGIEQSQEYCAWTQKRLSLAASDRTIQGYRDGVFLERNFAFMRS
ncbi:MAG: site-specific DNA-methyltransferase [Treponema sp.]|nr:site-specific DNA-methyltransferase [Treponema sp.]